MEIGIFHGFPSSGSVLGQLGPSWDNKLKHYWDTRTDPWKKKNDFGKSSGRAPGCSSVRIWHFLESWNEQGRENPDPVWWLRQEHLGSGIPRSQIALDPWSRGGEPGSALGPLGHPQSCKGKGGAGNFIFFPGDFNFYSFYFFFPDNFIFFHGNFSFFPR